MPYKKLKILHVTHLKGKYYKFQKQKYYLKLIVLTFKMPGKLSKILK